MPRIKLLPECQKTIADFDPDLKAVEAEKKKKRQRKRRPSVGGCSPPT